MIIKQQRLNLHVQKLKEYIYNYPVVFLALLFGILFPLTFSHLINADFISWDDREYVLENRDVQTFNFGSFFTKFYVGNYHPFTMLNYAVDWKLFGNNASGYHIENIIWHFVNSLLAFIVCKKVTKSVIASFIISVIFAFHPMQIETVAWIAERKNLTYAFFFLIGIYTYLKYLEGRETQHLVITFIYFLFSIMSKPSAIVFPIVLLLLDWLVNKEIRKKALIQKSSFFVMSIIFSIVTYKAQFAGNYINTTKNVPLTDKISNAGYALFQYGYKTIAPINLSVIYPYPKNKESSMALGFLFIVFLLFIFYSLYKSKQRLLFFGLLFFVINLLLVLQLVPFGEAITADRYMYLAIIGLAIIVCDVFNRFKVKLYILFMILLITLPTLAFKRIYVWKNSIALYEDILKKHPNSYEAQNSLGAEHLITKNYTLALKHINLSLNENKNFHKAYYNRGLLYAQINEFKKALKDFNTCIKLNNYTKAYVARASVFYLLNDGVRAKQDAEYVLQREPNNVKANYVLATCYDDLNNLDYALQHYNSSINNQTLEPQYYLRRGVLYGKMRNRLRCRCFQVAHLCAQSRLQNWLPTCRVLGRARFFSFF